MEHPGGGLIQSFEFMANELFRLGFDACEELLADLDPREAA